MWMAWAVDVFSVLPQVWILTVNRSHSVNVLRITQVLAVLFCVVKTASISPRLTHYPVLFTVITAPTSE